MVPDGLPMAADGNDAFGRHSGFREQRLDHSGIASRQSVACERDPMDLVVARAIERQKFGTHGRCEIGMLVGQDPEQCRSRGGEVDEDAVNPVERGPRHEADEDGVHSEPSGFALRHSPLGRPGGLMAPQAYSPRTWACASVCATPSWARTLCDSCASCALAAGVSTTPSDDCATSTGSCWTPSILISKCRCGPVAQPVWPTAPIVWPCSTFAPLATSMWLRWA